MLFLLFTVGFLAVHPNAGSHFSALGEVLQENGISYVAYGADQAKKKMEDRIDVIDISEIECPLSQWDDSKLAEKAISLAKQISREVDLLLMDVGSPFSKLMIEALKSTNVDVWPYYDNFESFVPGGYSNLAGEIIALAGKSLYASAHLSEEFGIGYYPLEDLEEILDLKSSPKKKELFFEKHRLDPSLPLMVFLGGASKAYENVFYHFVDSVRDGINGWNIVLQRHPRAEEEGILDADIIQGGPLVLSEASIHEALAFADIVGYYQTTSSLKSILVGTPTFEWGGFEDCFVKAGLIPMLNDRFKLEEFLNAPFCPIPALGLKLVGYSPNWKEKWLNFVSFSEFLLKRRSHYDRMLDLRISK